MNIPKRFELFQKNYQASILFSYLLVITLSSLLYFRLLPNPLWVINSLFQICFFIVYSNFIYNLSLNTTTKKFLKIIFFLNIVVGSFWVVCVFSFYIAMTGQPFEFYASDGLEYYNKGKEIALLLPNFGLWESVSTVLGGAYGLSDYGFFLYNGVLTYLFNDTPLIGRLLNVLWFSISIIFLYKISLICFSKRIYAVISIALMMSVPNFYIYAAGNRKEIMMILFLLGFLYFGLKVLYLGEITVRNITLSFLFLVFIFFMRPLLCIVSLYALFIAYLNSEYFKGKVLSKSFIWLGVFTSVFLVLFLAWDVLEVMWNYSQVATEANNTNKANSSGGNLSAYPVWFYFSLFPFAPVPGFIELPGKENEMFMAGAQFIKVLYTALFIFGSGIAYKLKSARWIFHFIIIYFLALAINGYTVDTRFHMVLLPFIFLIVPFSTELKFRFKWLFYCTFCFLNVVFIIAWNYFRIGIWQ
jgi:hypothetical protein